MLFKLKGKLCKDKTGVRALKSTENKNPLFKRPRHRHTNILLGTSIADNSPFCNCTLLPSSVLPFPLYSITSAGSMNYSRIPYYPRFDSVQVICWPIQDTTSFHFQYFPQTLSFKFVLHKTRFSFVLKELTDQHRNQSEKLDILL